MTTPALTRTHVIYGALLFGIGLLYLLLARPHVTGFEYDDGAYLLAAKALANGQGYVLPYTHPLQALVKYPPLTSIIMTPLWWLPVEFPANVMLFKGLNILLTLTFLGMLGYYAERVIKLPRWQSLCVVGLVGCHPQLTHVATEILSEPLYLVLSMGLFLLSVRCHSGNGALKTDREGSFATTGMLLAGVLLLLAVLAYYARTVGIILVGALGLWLFVSHRKKHALLAWFFGFGLCALWMLWTSAQADFTTPLSLNGREWVLRTLNESYLTSIKTDLLYHYTWIDLYSSGLAALYGKWSIELFPFLSLLPSWVALASGFGLLGLFLLLGLKHLKQKQWSLPGIYVTLYLGILPFWAYHDQYPRFLIVILPFLWLWLFQLANKAHRKLPSKTPHIVIPVLVLAISICNLIPNGFRIVFDRGNAITFKNNPPVWVDFIATTDAIKQRTTPDTILWVSHLVMPYALYTNRQYFDAFIQLPPMYLRSMQESELKKIQRDQAILWRYQLIKNNVQYIVSNPVLENGQVVSPMNHAIKTLLEQYPNEFESVYTSPHQLIRVFKFTGKT